MNKRTAILLTFITSIFILNGCNNDDESTSETEAEKFLCCGENPFESLIVDNLDQSALGIIEPIEIFTPNSDGINDHFEIENLEFYPNNIVTIYDLDNNVVFERENYNDVDESIPGIPANLNAFQGVNPSNNSVLESGSYKYKIVVENENTYLQLGYVCFVRNYEDYSGDDINIEGISFFECMNGFFDPIILF